MEQIIKNYMRATIITVRQQTEFKSKQWGIYANGALIEGGFFDKAAAETAANIVAEDMRQDNPNVLVK